MPAAVRFPHAMREDVNEACRCGRVRAGSRGRSGGHNSARMRGLPDSRLIVWMMVVPIILLAVWVLLDLAGGLG